MAWNKEYLLRRIILIQNITLEHKAKGATQIWIYHNVIYPQFLISEPTFRSYLQRNAKAELKDLLNQPVQP
ncbi:MAG: hypothetical protein LBD76_05380 [Prevotellaceae bacterium]|jgi:hypothetical protein|nr:hypothetical protein [Prevotellaceae bacterium]